MSGLALRRENENYDHTGHSAHINRPNVVYRVTLISLLVLLSLAQLAPFVIAVSNSLKCLPALQAFPESFLPNLPIGVECRTETGVAKSPSETSGSLFFNPTIEGYSKVLELNFLTWFQNSMIYAIGVTVMRLFLDSLAGYALAKLRFKGNRLIFVMLLGMMMIPGVVLLIPRFIILQQLGLLNSYVGVFLTLGVDAFGIFLMKQYFETIPDELIEAAKIDGAGPFRTFWSVVLPITRPGLVALAILSFGSIWNSFIDLLVIVGGKQEMLNLPLGLALLRGQFGETLIWNVFLAGSVITTLPMVILFFIFQKQFVSSELQAGMKG